MKWNKLALLPLLVVACAAIAQPRGMVTMLSSAQSIAITYGCDVDAPSIECDIELREDGAVVLPWSVVPRGASDSLPTRVCVAVDTITITGRFVGRTATGKLSDTTDVVASAVCDPDAATPRGFLRVEVTP